MYQVREQATDAGTTLFPRSRASYLGLACHFSTSLLSESLVQAQKVVKIQPFVSKIRKDFVLLGTPWSGNGYAFLSFFLLRRVIQA